MAQKKTRGANTLRAIVRSHHTNMRELAQDSGIGESTLHTWATEGHISKREHILTLASVLGCNPKQLDNLVPDDGFQEDHSRKLGARQIYEELDMHFAFGNMRTTSLVLDGNGEEAYRPANIHTHYDPHPAMFLDEIMDAKIQIEEEQEERKAQRKPHQWNGEKYHLSGVVVSREPVHEQMTLGLWFKPRDHYTGLATRRCLDNPAFREKYLVDHDWYTPIESMSMSMGVDLTVITSDGYALLTQRGSNQSVNSDTFHSSVSEAVSPQFDRSSTSQAPDLYRCACRGLAEELGLREPTDFSASDIQFLSVTVDTHYALYGLRGMVKVRREAKDVIRNWHQGVKDKMENKQVVAVPFTPHDITSFVLSHEPWAGGLVCLYHSLVHEFGRHEIESAISAIEQRDE